MWLRLLLDALSLTFYLSPLSLSLSLSLYLSLVYFHFRHEAEFNLPLHDLERERERIFRVQRRDEGIVEVHIGTVMTSFPPFFL